MKKQKLFDFVSIARPQQITEDAKNLGFIFHPDSTQSDFLSAVASLENHGDIHNQLHTSADNMTSPFTSLGEVRDVDNDLFTFSLELSKTEKLKDLNHYLTSTASLSVLDNTDLSVMVDRKELWENLFYQVTKNSNPDIADAIIRMLIGNYFLSQFKADETANEFGADFTSDQEKKYARLLKAVVVIPKKIGARNKTLLTSDEVSDNSYSSTVFQLQEIAIAKSQGRQLTEALEEIQRVGSRWESDESKREISFNEDERKTYDGNSSYTMKGYVRNPSDDFTDLYVKSKVSKKASSLFNYHDDGSADYRKVLEAIQKKKAEFAQGLSSLRANGERTVLMNGSSFILRDVPQIPTCTIKILPSAFIEDEYIVVVGVFSLSESFSVTRVQVSATPQQGTGLSQAVITPQHKVYNYSSFELFDTTGLEIVNNSATDLAITIETSNHGTFSFDANDLNIGETKMHLLNSSSEEGTLDAQADNRLYGVTNLGIAKYRRVEQELCKYIEGEVSHIENIMAFEYKERSTRQLNRSEVTDLQSSEEEVENQTDTSTTDRYEMQSEIEKVIEEQSSKNYGASLSGNVGKTGDGWNWGVSANAFANFSRNSSRSDSDRNAITEAQELTEKTTERILRKVKSSRESRMIREFEENNKHGFDNRGDGATNVTGIYRWIDKVYKNSILNYGQRMLLEFAIPEPSLGFKASLENTDAVPSSIVLLTKPKNPKDLGLSTPEDLNEENIGFFTSLYEAEVGAYPDQLIQVSRAYSKTYVNGTNLIGYHNSEAYNDFIIPDGYQAVSVRAAGAVHHQYGYDSSNVNDREAPKGSVVVGPHQFVITNSEPITLDANILPVQGSLSVVIRTTWSSSFSFTINAICEVNQNFLNQWKRDAFNQIIDAYKEQIDRYNEQMAVVEVEGLNSLQMNPRIARAIEMQEIKRIAIELMSKPFEIQTSRNNYNSPDEFNVSSVNRSEEMERHASHARFFEQAFEWDIMAYQFYPYYYAQKEKWHKLMNSTNNADLLFQAFLQSGMSRAVLPVRKGFEHAVNLYLETGVIWGGNGYTLETDDDLYLSIEEELQAPEYTIEETWESTIPTSLKMIQRASTDFDDDGLPNFCDEEPVKIGEAGEGNSSSTLSPSIPG